MEVELIASLSMLGYKKQSNPVKKVQVLSLDVCHCRSMLANISGLREGIGQLGIECGRRTGVAFVLRPHKASCVRPRWVGGQSRDYSVRG